MPCPEDLPQACENPENGMIRALDRARNLECFLECLCQIPTIDRISILQYYPAESESIEESREKLAQTLGIETNALRTRISRLKTTITRKFLDQCSQPRRGSRTAVYL